MNALPPFPLLAEAAPEKTMLSWIFESLGPFYGTLFPVLGVVLFVGACIVVAMSRRPAVVAAYLVFLPLPILIGAYASLEVFVMAYAIIAQSTTPPRYPVIVEGISTALMPALIGIMVTIPAYLITAFGLFFRTLRASGKEGNAKWE